MRLYSFRLSEDLKAALELLKERDGIPESEAIRRGATQFLKERGITVGSGKGSAKGVKAKKRQK